MPLAGDLQSNHLELKREIGRQHGPACGGFLHGQLAHNGLTIVDREHGAELPMVIALPGDEQAGAGIFGNKPGSGLVLAGIAIQGLCVSGCKKGGNAKIDEI